jgi:hypothetical protein
MGCGATWVSLQVNKKKLYFIKRIIYYYLITPILGLYPNLLEYDLLLLELILDANKSIYPLYSR